MEDHMTNGFGCRGMRSCGMVPQWRDLVQTEPSYLAAEFAVLRAMQGETMTDVNNVRSGQRERETHTDRERERGSWHRVKHSRVDVSISSNMQVVNSVRNTKTLRSLRGHLSPIYLARSSLRSLASFCRCSELMESGKNKNKKHRDLSYE